MKEKNCFVVCITILLFTVIISIVAMLEAIVLIDEYNQMVCNFEEAVIEKENTEILVVLCAEDCEEEPEEEKESLGEFRLTAYCPCEKCCGEWARNRPKDGSGKEIVYGSSGAVLSAGKSVAVDPDVIPYGSEIEINGHTYTAQDCGGAIKGNRIDVYFDSHEDALGFGVQYSEVFLLEVNE